MHDTPSYSHLDAARRPAATLRDATLRRWSGIRTAHPQIAGKWWLKPPARTALAAVVVAGAYYLGSLVGLSIRFESSPISPIWPPNTILLVALLLVPMQAWWLCLLAVFGAHMLVELPSGIPLATAIGLYFTNAGEAALGAFLIRRLSDGAPWLGTLRRMAVYVACAVVAAPVITSFGDAAVVVLTRWGGNNYWLNWETRSVSNVLAELTIGPALLLVLTRASTWKREVVRQRWVEITTLSVALLLVGVVAFGGQISWPGSATMLVYAVLPVLLWAAVRFGVGGTSAALLGITVVATWSAAQERGPFSAYSPTENVIALQVFLICFSIPLLILAAVIEERQHALVALRASEARFRAAFASAATGMMLVSTDGHPLQVNHPLVAMLGYSEEEFRLRTFADFTHPDDQEPNLTLFRRAVAGELDSYQVDKRFVHKQGHVVWSRVSAGVVRDAAGQALYLVGQVEDITERKRLEQEREAARAEAERQAEELDRIFETMADGVVVYDAQGRTLRTNMAAHQLMGLDAAPPNYYELPAHERVSLFLTRDDQGRLLAPDDLASRRALRGEVLTGASALDITSRSFDGRERDLNVSAAPLRDADGHIIGAVAIVRDLTERKWLEREREEARASELALREVNERLDTFATMAAHDLRSPVGVSRMALERAQQVLTQASAEVLPESENGSDKRIRAFVRVAQALGATEESLDRLWRLVQQLLDVSRVKKGTLVLQRQPVQLAALVRACVDEQRLLNPARVIALDVPDPADIPANAPREAGARSIVVDADEDRLGQVLTNYLTNAQRYSPEDRPIEVTLRLLDVEAADVSAEAGPDSGPDGGTGAVRRVARVEVRDHGVGITTDDQATIWNRFQRARNVNEASGLGLGLYIARTIVELHGGRVGVESSVGQGSTFWFTLPLAPVVASSSALKVPRFGRQGFVRRHSVFG
ncbi:MAG TPA: PAS domain S-box protein [Ktedonobacterales bacterium]|nr:PAS domain S-box protein [Ktedonobacterales bacterium]